MDEDPRRQFDWALADHFEAPNFPHRSLLAHAAIPNVQGLIRNEMMIVTGMMIAVMREKGNEDHLIDPVSRAVRYTSIIDKRKLTTSNGSWFLSQYRLSSPGSFKRMFVSTNSGSESGTASCTILKIAAGARWISSYPGSSATHC